MSFHLGKPRLPSVEYYPNNLGNLTVGTARSYAFLVYGRDERGIQVQILNTLNKRGARIISHNGYADEKNREFTLCVSCDLGEVSVTPDDLVIELRRMKQVRNAMAICLKNRLFDGFMFPLTMLITGRVIALDSNIPFLIQDRLNTEEARIGLRDVGHDYAIDVIRQVREKLSSGYPEELIQENVRGYLKAAGWGSFTWESETSFERITVVDPPIFSGKAIGNYFLHGIASGLLESFRKKKFSLAEEVYNQDTRSLTLMLSERRIEVKRLDSQTDKKLPKPVEVKALEEVEKVIRSVEIDELEEETPPIVAPAEQPKPVILVQQSGVEEKAQSAGPPVQIATPTIPEPLQVKASLPTLAPAQILAPIPLPTQVKIEQPKPTMVTTPQKEEADEESEKVEITPASKPTAKTSVPVIGEAKPPVEEKKPLRVIEVKKIREKEESEDEEDDFNPNELWFEQAVREE